MSGRLMFTAGVFLHPHAIPRAHRAHRAKEKARAASPNKFLSVSDSACESSDQTSFVVLFPLQMVVAEWSSPGPMKRPRRRSVPF